MKPVKKTVETNTGRMKRIPLWPDIENGQIRNTSSVPFQKIAFHVQNGVEFIDPMVVTHLQAQSNYTTIHCQNRRIMVSKTLKDIARIFPANFLRIHQTYLVNPQHIQTYLRHDQELKLDNGMLIPVSRSGKTVMQEFLKRTTC
jgi:two-component system LytT family response regulator